MREDFETWAKDRHMNLERAANGTYYGKTHDAYVIWCAAFATRPNFDQLHNFVYDILGKFRDAVSQVTPPVVAGQIDGLMWAEEIIKETLSKWTK